jgi:hypothetical protein
VAAATLVCALLLGPGRGIAQTNLEADFRGVFSYSRSTFQPVSGFGWGDLVSGRLAWNADLVPLTSTAYNLPVLDLVVRLDPNDGVHSAVELTGAGAEMAMAQWKDGAFAGLVFASPFNLGADWFYLSIQGRSWTINGYDAATGAHDFVTHASGSLDAQLANVHPFGVSSLAVSTSPEPGSLALLGSGLLALTALRRRRKSPAERG